MNRLYVRARMTAARFLPASSPVGRVARRIMRLLGMSRPRHSVRVINQFARLNPTATFVQVGANDGAALDPLHEAVARRRWTGIMVEPVPYVCQRLQSNMAGNSRVKIENVAIAEQDGTKEFFHLAEAGAGESIWEWYHALGSFDREVLMSHRHLIPDIDSRMVSTFVDCLTFDSLCARHDLSAVDVIQIDTEGYDHVVLGLVDLDRYQPNIVMFEHVHLPKGAHAEIEQRLRRHEYETFSDGMDTVAVHKQCLARYPALARAVRSARRDLEN